MHGVISQKKVMFIVNYCTEFEVLSGVCDEYGLLGCDPV
jgi:hypothetical protein